MVLQAANSGHAQDAPPGHVDEPDVEYGTKSGVRCLVCGRVMHDKSGYNRHCSSSVGCREVRLFRHIRKRIGYDEEAAAASAAAFTTADNAGTRNAAAGAAAAAEVV